MMNDQSPQEADPHILGNLQRLLNSGEHPRIDLLGSLARIRANAVSIGDSHFLSDVINYVLGEDAFATDENARQEVIAELIERSSDPVAVREAFDAWGNWCEKKNYWCFLYNTALPYALDVRRDTFSRVGALEWATIAGLADAPNVKFSMISEFLSADIGTSLDFDRHLAVVLGICFDASPQKELVDRIRQLADLGGNFEATFELGFVYLRYFLEAQTQEVAGKYQSLARHQFSYVSELTEGWPDAHIFAASLDALQSFAHGNPTNLIKQLSNEIDRAIFELHAYHRSDTDSLWLKSRTATVTLWKDLATKLRKLTEQLDHPAWYPADIVIRDQLIPLYTASRTIFRKAGVYGGVEILVSGRIEASVAANEAHVHVLTQFLERDATGDERDALKSLVNALPCASTPETLDYTPFVELHLGHLRIGDTDRLRIATAINTIMEVRLRSFSATAAEKLAHVLSVFEQSPDYQKSKEIADLAAAVATMTIQFVELRLNASPKSAPYLFVDNKRGRALESDLQNDYFNWMSSGLGATSCEVDNVGGGRADVLFRLGAEQLVAEVKREDRDASFDALEIWYGNQTVAYQQTSGRIGVLLVLDQVKRDGPPPHLTELIQARTVRIVGTDDVRTMLIVRVPGERMTPSQQSKVAKAGGLHALQEKKKSFKGG